MGDRLQHRFTVRAGEMAYIPAGVPHLPMNASQDEPVTCIVARTDPNEQESVVVLPELEGADPHPSCGRQRRRTRQRPTLTHPRPAPPTATLRQRQANRRLLNIAHLLRADVKAMALAVDAVGMTVAGAQQRESPRAVHLSALGGLTMSSERERDVHTIRVVGELDLVTATGVERELERVERTEVRSIVVDLSGLTFMDATGFRLLWSAHARSRADGNRLTLIRAPAAVQRLFEISGVDELLPFTR